MQILCLLWNHEGHLITCSLTFRLLEKAVFKNGYNSKRSTLSPIKMKFGLPCTLMMGFATYYVLIKTCFDIN